MSSTHLNTLFFLSIILLCFPGTTRSDNPCPYPCYPSPPTGGGGITPTTPSGSTTPPAPPQTGLAYPPPPPSGYYPNNPTPPFGGSGDGNGNGNSNSNSNGGFGAPPPPDPILPYFPFYYRKPPHQTEDQSSASASTMVKWTGMISTTSTLFLVSLLILV